MSRYSLMKTRRDPPDGDGRSLALPRRALQRLYDWLRGSPTGLVGLALATGLGAGLGAIVFRGLITGFTLAFTGHGDYGATERAIHPMLPWAGVGFVVAVPVVGGLLYGPLIDRFAREARGHGVPEVMLAVAEQGGRIRPRVAVIKSVASAICLGAGGSVGREGPIVQIGSALGSAFGQLLRLSEANLRLLVACGAAGGISATFNAPIAGVFFSLELILRDFEVRSFGAVVLASVAADVVSRAAFGSSSFLPLPEFSLVSGWEFPLYALLGLVAALVGVAFTKVLYGTQDLVDRLWHGRPEWLRPAVGGIPLGLLLLALPQLYGVGYAPLEQAVHGNYAIALLVVLLIGKLAATSLTIGIGGSGGVFAPSLFMGGMLGTAFGDVANSLLPGITAPAGAYALVGMGAVFAAAARAPITSVLIMFELTGDYQIILPLMFAIALAGGVSPILTNDTIYTLKLRRRGVNILRGRAANLMELLTVGDAMRPVPAGLAQSAQLADVIDRFIAEEVEALPVVDEQGAYRGVVTAQEVEECMRTNAFDMTAGDLAQDIPALAARESVEQALGRLLRQEAAGLPVVGASGHVIGWITHRDVLTAYNARIGEHVARAEEGGAPPGLLGPHRRRSALSRLGGYRIEELELTGDDPPVGKRIGEIAWPAFSLPIAVRREGRTFTPAVETRLHTGDRVTVLISSEHADELADVMAGIPRVGQEEAEGEGPPAPPGNEAPQDRNEDAAEPASDATEPPADEGATAGPPLDERP